MIIITFKGKPVTVARASEQLRSGDYRGSRANMYFVGKTEKDVKKDFLFFFEINEEVFSNVGFSVKKFILPVLS